MATEQDKVNTGALATIAAVLALSVLGIALAVTALVRSTEEDNVNELAAYARKPIDDAKSQWQKDLEAPATWAKKGETASVPIERAMAIVVKQISENPASATPPQPPPDAGAEAATTAEDGGTAEEGGAESADAEATGEAADAGSQLADAAPEVTDAAPKKAPKPKLGPPPGGGAAPPPPTPPAPEPPPEAP